MTSLSKDATVLPLAQSGGGAPEDALRTMLQHLIHTTLECEFQQFLGAVRFERSPERRGVRKWKVSAVVEQPCGTTIPASEVSALTKTPDTLAVERNEQWLARRYVGVVPIAHAVDGAWIIPTPRSDLHTFLHLTVPWHRMSPATSNIRQNHQPTPEGAS